METWIIALAAFFGVTTLIGAVMYFMRDMGQSTTEDRLEILTGRRNIMGDGEAAHDDIVKEGFGGAIDMFTGLSKRFENMRYLFEQADSPIKADVFFGISLGAAVIGLAGSAIVNAPLPLYPVAALACGSTPLIWLMMRRRARFKKFAKQLPDALELIARALRSGHSLSSGINVVVQEMPMPVATEFEVAYEQQNLGVPVEHALRNMLTRVPNLDLKFFVTAVAIQKQAGGDLAEILEKIGYIIRERFKIMGMVQALTGEGRISGVVLMGLPIALFVAVYYLNPSYVMLLFTDPLGKQMLGFAAVLQVLGAVVIKKIVDIKI